MPLKVSETAVSAEVNWVHPGSCGIGVDTCAKPIAMNGKLPAGRLPNSTDDVSPVHGDE